MVVAPWRRLISAARWNTLPAEKYTSVVAANAAHCQFGNCRPCTIDTSMTGTVTSAAQIVVRLSRSASSSRASLTELIDAPSSPLSSPPITKAS